MVVFSLDFPTFECDNTPTFKILVGELESGGLVVKPETMNQKNLSSRL